MTFSSTTIASSTTKPGRDRERHEREVVEAVAAEVHHPERADERERDGDARDERRAHVAEEQRRPRGPRGRWPRRASARHPAARRGSSPSGRPGSTAGRRSEWRRGAGATGSRTRSTVSMMFAPGWRNRITVHRRLAVRPAPALRRSSTESSTRATSDRRTARAALVREDHRPILLGVAELVVGGDLPGPVAVGQLALGPADVGRGERAPHVLEADPVLRERRRVQLDPHGRERAAAHDRPGRRRPPGRASAGGSSTRRRTSARGSTCRR